MPEQKEEENHFLLGYVFVAFINDYSAQLHKLWFFKGQIYFFLECIDIPFFKNLWPIRTTLLIIFNVVIISWCICQIMMHTLNLYGAGLQLYLNETGRTSPPPKIAFLIGREKKKRKSIPKCNVLSIVTKVFQGQWILARSAQRKLCFQHHKKFPTDLEFFFFFLTLGKMLMSIFNLQYGILSYRLGCLVTYQPAFFTAFMLTPFQI